MPSIREKIEILEQEQEKQRIDHKVRIEIQNTSLKQVFSELDQVSDKLTQVS